MCWQMSLPYVEDIKPHLIFFFFVFFLAGVVAMVADGIATLVEC